MTDVVIDGVTYTPANQTADVGIAVTVRNRHSETRQMLDHLRKVTPASFPILIVDDASDTPFDGADYRFAENAGIPRAKNKCLEVLLDHPSKPRHLFLFDNDAWPVVENWWRPFTTSGVHHMSAQFEDLSGARKLGDIKVIYRDGKREAWTGQRGYCLYYTREAVETVGGFDPIYSPGLYEHSDLANRIHAAGLTDFRYQSPPDSHLLIRSLDREEKVERTPLPGRQQLVERNVKIHNSRREQGYTAYVEPREQHDIILTCLYTGQVDPQRGVKMKPDASALAGLVDSAGSNRVVVLYDEPFEAIPGVEFHQAPNTVNVYFQRWINALAYLEARPHIRNVLVCDGTDVEILKPDRLFDNITPGTVRVGSEFQVVGCKWLRDNHPDRQVQEWIEANKERQLLNAGVLLGGRDDVIRFIRRMVQVWADIEMDQFHGKSAGNGVGDMAVFNMVGYELGAEFGPHVTTRFKGEERNDFSIIKHK